MKSQLYSQIFIYILTIILISFILVYGYNSIQKFRERAEQVACLKFENELRDSVEVISRDFGSVKRKELQLCKSYKRVCFVESHYKIPNKGSPISNIVPVDPIIKDSILSNTAKNVFLIESIAKDSFYIGNVSVRDKEADTLDVLCINAKNNRVSIRLEGKGNHAFISQWA